MTDITELVVSHGGSTVVASDVMLADVASLSAISAGLNRALLQLSIADATAGQSALAATQVGWGRAAMADARTAATTAKDICDYLVDQLGIAIENYTETENNVELLAGGVDMLLAFLLGKSLALYADTLGPAGEVLAWLLPQIMRSNFEGDSDPIGARDVGVPGPVNSLLVDDDVIAAIRRLVMHPEAFVSGYGDIPASVRTTLEGAGLDGVALSGALLMIYAGQAGMLGETRVTTSKTASQTRQGDGVGSTREAISAIPDPALRPDGAQIRIDTIRDGGEVRYEVFIAGTADFGPIARAEPFDFTSNVAGVSGQSPASLRATQEAMAQAGITASSPVSFVGYSQGGLIATMLAASGDYDARGLITIGSPAGQIATPAGMPALIMEHYEDLIPALGGTQVETGALVVQRHAFSDARPADLGLAVPGHQLQYYLETASLVDNAESEQLVGTVAALTAFSEGDSVTSTWYRAERAP